MEAEAAKQRKSMPSAGSAQAGVIGPDHARLASLAATLNAAPPVQRLANSAPRNRTGLPDNLKAGVEALSGVSLDEVRVHRNSSKPAQLNAHAYAQGTEIHLAAGQEGHLPHEAWHVVQQAQGRVRPTMQMKAGVQVNDEAHLEEEADSMGARASTVITQHRAVADRPVSQRARIDEEQPLQAKLAPPRAGSVGGVVQRVLVFRVDPETYKVTNATYHRVKGGKFMIGNADKKHVTADTLKDMVYNDVNGINIAELAQRIINVSTIYENLPGLDLVEAHSDYEEPSDDEKEKMVDEGTEDKIEQKNDAISENFTLFSELRDKISQGAYKLYALKNQFEWAGGGDKEGALAFQLQNHIITMTELLEQFRDLMPLVNIWSGVQKGAREKDANKFLKKGIKSKGIDSNLDALWAYFDFAAIAEIADTENNDEDVGEQIVAALPWLDLERARAVAAEVFNTTSDNVTDKQIADYVAALMIANHIKLVMISYPDATAQAEIWKGANIKQVLDKHQVPVDRDWVANYAASRM